MRRIPDRDELLRRVRRIHTLGPQGTNCEAAALEWFARRGVEGEVLLYRTLESAIPAVDGDPEGALLGCVVYPDLHTLVFRNLATLTLADCFVMHTHDMVLAARGDDYPRSVATHPAPESLIPAAIHDRRLVTSNAEAARVCARGEVDGCITTGVAAHANGLRIVTDFGRVAMGFTIHVPARASLGSTGGAA
jgi:prephenate dehydratase